MKLNHLFFKKKSIFKAIFLAHIFAILSGFGINGFNYVAAQKTTSGASAVQAAAVKSLLWKVEGKGLTSPSFVYGTMHSKNKNVYEFGEAVIKSIESCKGFVGELALEPEAMMEAQKKLMMPEGKTLSTLLSKKEYELANKVFQSELNMPLSMFDRVKPSFVLVSLTSADLLKGEMEQALDQYLYNYAKQNGKTTGGLETMDEQINALAGMTLEEQVKYFNDGIKKYDKQKKEYAKMQTELTTLYLGSDVEALAKMVDDTKESDMPKKMKTELVGKRNKIMADRFSDLIAKQSTFAAVGAAHLGGSDGVIALLRQKGYTVTAVPFKFDGGGLKYIESKGTTPAPAATNSNTAPTAAISKSTRADGWVHYIAPEGGYSVLFPSNPTERKQNVGEGENAVTTYMAMVQDLSAGKAFTSHKHIELHKF